MTTPKVYMKFPITKATTFTNKKVKGYFLSGLDKKINLRKNSSNCKMDWENNSGLVCRIGIIVRIEFSPFGLIGVSKGH